MERQGVYCPNCRSEIPPLGVAIDTSTYSPPTGRTKGSVPAYWFLGVPVGGLLFDAYLADVIVSGRDDKFLTSVVAIGLMATWPLPAVILAAKAGYGRRRTWVVLFVLMIPLWVRVGMYVDETRSVANPTAQLTLARYAVAQILLSMVRCFVAIFLARPRRPRYGRGGRPVVDVLDPRPD